MLSPKGDKKGKSVRVQYKWKHLHRMNYIFSPWMVSVSAEPVDTKGCAHSQVGFAVIRRIRQSLEV